MPVEELERELERQAGLSRGAVENSLQYLVKANLLGISLSGRNRVCELRRAKLWAKLGEVLELESEQPTDEPAGMPWLAEVVANKPRRGRLPIRPPKPEPHVSLAETEALLANLPVDEQPSMPRRSPAPGRRKEMSDLYLDDDGATDLHRVAQKLMAAEGLSDDATYARAEAASYEFFVQVAELRRVADLPSRQQGEVGGLSVVALESFPGAPPGRGASHRFQAGHHGHDFE